MPIITFRYRKFVALFFIVVIAITVITGVKWVGKTLYPLHYENYIIKYSAEYNLDPFLVASVIREESRFYKSAESPKGARGLMQITPPTGEWIAGQMGIDNYEVDMLYDPEVNIRFGCWYLDNLRNQFGDMKLVIAAYNGGRGNVTKWLMNKDYSRDGRELHHIPFKETRNYVIKVEKSYKIYQLLYKNKISSSI